jgi:hypothetical protein
MGCLLRRINGPQIKEARLEDAGTILEIAKLFATSFVVEEHVAIEQSINL